MPTYTFPNTKNRYNFSGPIIIDYEIPEIISDEKFLENWLPNNQALLEIPTNWFREKTLIPNRFWGVPASHPYFLVSNYGDCVINENFPHISIKFVADSAFSNRDGYNYVNISSLLVEKKNAVAAVHRLVAEIFIENPLHKPFVNHIDKNRSNNLWFNLEWVTHKENLLHSAYAGKYTAAPSVTKDKDTGLYGIYVPELKGENSFNNKHEIGMPVFFGKRKDAVNFANWLTDLRKQDLGESNLIELVQKAVDVEKVKLRLFLEEKGFTGFYVPADIRSQKSKDITPRKYTPLLPAEKAEAIQLRDFRKTQKNLQDHFIDESFRSQLLTI